ncbi:MAG: aminotransferase [Candidatus Xenobia bacterium]|jgi:putrescine aminotransferase
MRDWLDYPEVLDEAEYAQLLADQLDLQERHMNPTLARSLRALGSALVEWRGEGAYLIDPRGRRYYDCMGAGGTFGLGHAHPKVIEAVKRQLERAALSTRAGIVPGQAVLAARLSARVPGNLPFCAFLNSGTEAVEAALKLARLATGRPRFIGMHMGYHGMSIGTLSVGGIDYWKSGTPNLSDATIVPFLDVAALEKAMGPDVAAVILEPVQWASGCSVATPEYLRRVRALCDAHGALLIADEIQSGLGRTGRWFALDASGVVPDLICVGKVLSGAVCPVSAVLYSARVRAAEEARPLFNNSTFAGNPLACAAGVATLDALESEKLVERSAHLGNLLEKGFDELCRDFPDLAVGHRGVGLMRCLCTTAPAVGLTVQEMIREEHSILLTSMVHCPEVIRVSPPYVSSDADLKHLLETWRSLFDHMQKIGPQGINGYLMDIANRINSVVRR